MTNDGAPRGGQGIRQDMGMLLERYLKDRPKSGKLREQAVELFTATGATHSA